MGRGLELALVTTLPLMGVLFGVLALVPGLGFNEETLLLLRGYFAILIWSTPLLLVYAALRRYLQSPHHVAPVMVALVSANLVNAGADWVLIYGAFGVPALGVSAAAWATVISRLYMCGLLAGAVWRTFGRVDEPTSHLRPPTSDLPPPTCHLRPPTSDLRHGSALDDPPHGDAVHAATRRARPARGVHRDSRGRRLRPCNRHGGQPAAGRHGLASDRAQHRGGGLHDSAGTRVRGCRARRERRGRREPAVPAARARGTPPSRGGCATLSYCPSMDG
jgi:hypothetical protein